MLPSPDRPPKAPGPLYLTAFGLCSALGLALVLAAWADAVRQALWYFA